MDKKGKFSKNVLLFLAIFTIIFMVVMTTIFCIKDSIPDTLVERYFSCCIGECGILGLIKGIKTIFPDTKQEEDEEKEDLVAISGDDTESIEENE